VCVLKLPQIDLVMKVMKKYGIVEFYDKKGFELSKTFATVLASCSTQHPNLLISIMYAVKSYADEASDNEKTLICTHLAMHVIPHDKRVEVVETLMPILEEIRQEIGGKTMFDMICNMVKDDTKYT